MQKLCSFHQKFKIDFDENVMFMNSIFTAIDVFATLLILSLNLIS